MFVAFTRLQLLTKFNFHSFTHAAHKALKILLSVGLQLVIAANNN